MRTRTRVRAVTAITYVDVRQSGMLVVTTTEQQAELLKSEQVRGAFVKFAPTLRASERASLDVKATRRAFLDAGASAVVIAPVVISDSTLNQKISLGEVPVVTPEMHLREWFESVKEQRNVIERAVAEALESFAAVQ